jgi:hypothetical protein
MGHGPPRYGVLDGAGMVTPPVQSWHVTLNLPSGSSLKTSVLSALPNLSMTFISPSTVSINYTAYDGESVANSAACAGISGAPMKPAMMHETEPANILA